MAAIAHGWHKPGGDAPPVKVAKEFNQADKGTGILEGVVKKKKRKGMLESIAGGQ